MSHVILASSNSLLRYLLIFSTLETRCWTRCATDNGNSCKDCSLSINAVYLDYAHHLPSHLLTEPRHYSVFPQFSYLLHSSVPTHWYICGLPAVSCFLTTSFSYPKYAHELHHLYWTLGSAPWFLLAHRFPALQKKAAFRLPGWTGEER